MSIYVFFTPYYPELDPHLLISLFLLFLKLRFSHTCPSPLLVVTAVQFSFLATVRKFSLRIILYLLCYYFCIFVLLRKKIKNICSQKVPFYAEELVLLFYLCNMGRRNIFSCRMYTSKLISEQFRLKFKFPYVYCIIFMYIYIPWLRLLT